MTSSIFIRLGMMMFFEFFIWGAWWVNLSIYMGTDKVHMTGLIWLAYLSSPLAGIISPFFLGLVADRFFATERVLGVLQIIGGVLLGLAPFFAEGLGGFPESGGLFILLLMLHMLCFMPTIGLTNTLAFHHLPNQDLFPYIRVFGTISWIISSGLIISVWLGAEAQALSLWIGAAASVLMGFYSFTLPHTPPPAAGKKVTVREVIGLDALSRLSSRPFWVFVVCSVLICIPLAAYYTYIGAFVNAMDFTNPNFKLTFGQMSEAGFMLLMPLGFAYLGTKWVLAVGMLAWAVRYALFALGAPDPGAGFWMIMVGIALHGVCFDFFFVAGQVYVDKKSPRDIRGQAQGFIVWATYGIGLFLGTMITGWWWFNDIVAGKEGQTLLNSYQTYWAIPAVVAVLVLLLFVALFRDREIDRPRQTAATDEAQVGRALAMEEQPGTG